jgi:hypothetical protein
MNKWILRLFVALATFTLSVVLTGALRFVFGGGSRPVIKMEEMVEEGKPFVGFSDDQAQISAIYREYGPAQTRHDRAFFERVEADNFTLFSGTESLTREEDIRWMESQPSDITYEVHVYHVRVFGNMAVSRGRIVFNYNTGATVEWPFIDVWVKRDGAWLIQSTTSFE